MRQTWWLRLVFAALVSLAVVDCGGDDGASGNGNNDDSADDGNGDDTGGPNPLIDLIPGIWYPESFDGLPNPDSVERNAGEVIVDTADPTCVAWARSKRFLGLSEEDVPRYERENPPGDGCVREDLEGRAMSPSGERLFGHGHGLEESYYILDGNRVRLKLSTSDSTEMDVFHGTVSDDGSRIEVTASFVLPDGRRLSGINIFRKVE